MNKILTILAAVFVVISGATLNVTTDAKNIGEWAIIISQWRLLLLGTILSILPGLVAGFSVSLYFDRKQDQSLSERFKPVQDGIRALTETVGAVKDNLIKLNGVLRKLADEFKRKERE